MSWKNKIIGLDVSFFPRDLQRRLDKGFTISDISDDEFEKRCFQLRRELIQTVLDKFDDFTVKVN